MPEDKIRERYQRLWTLVARARELSETTRFYDNSKANKALRLIARYERGVAIGVPAWPWWTPAVLRR